MSWLLTCLIRSYAIKVRLLDIPNARSSHTVATPRGGGIAIVCTYLVSLLILTGMGWIESSTLVGLLGAGGLVALVGFIDDHRHIPTLLRLFAHFVAAGWILLWFDRFSPVPVLGVTQESVWLGYLFVILYLVWLLNLYNFMDGIDGIAGIEAITVCIGGGLLYWIADQNSMIWLEPMLLFAAVTGFMFWNFPRARIFMGDSGSGFLGIMIGALSIQAAIMDPILIWGWIILLGAFLVDTTVTLLRRVCRGDKFYEAHRSHAYQYAARKYRSHTAVSLAFGAINLFWLLPIAIMVVVGLISNIVGVVIAYIPLVILALKYKAGAKGKAVCV